ACGPQEPSPKGADPVPGPDTSTPVEPDTDDGVPDGPAEPPLETDAPPDLPTLGDTAAPVSRGWAPATVEALPVATCTPMASPEGPRLVRPPPDVGWDNQTYEAYSRSLFVGGGLAVADLDGDGHLDVVRTAYSSRLVYLGGRADGGWDDRSATLPELVARTTGVTAVDVDADGDLDLHVNAFRDPSVLLRNDGAGVFTVDAAAPLPGAAGAQHLSSSFGDVDGDGDLDAFVAGYGPLIQDGRLPDGDPSSLYVQGPDGAFEDLVPARPMPDPLWTAHTFSGAFVDFDRDQRPGLYLVNDFGWTFPTLLLAPTSAGLVWRSTPLESVAENMGLALGDVNEDGVEDVFVAAWGLASLWISDPSLGWYEASAARGLVPNRDVGQEVGWGADFGDIDNDGDLDLASVYGELSVEANNANPASQPDALWVQGPDGTFADLAPSWGLDHGGRSRNVALVDLNRDGWLDQLTVDTRAPVLRAMGRCTPDGAFLLLEPRQPATANPWAIGAVVRVRAGDRTWMRTVRAGGTSYGVSLPPEVHVGLGDRDSVDAVEVIWPDGDVTSLQDVPTRQRLRVTRTPP
ncbi:MAG: hypothetical protein RLZZ383_714, partial [Pseudomonadota bacterium]